MITYFSPTCQPLSHHTYSIEGGEKFKYKTCKIRHELRNGKVYLLNNIIIIE